MSALMRRFWERLNHCLYRIQANSSGVTAFLFTSCSSFSLLFSLNYFNDFLSFTFWVTFLAFNRKRFQKHFTRKEAGQGSAQSQSQWIKGPVIIPSPVCANCCIGLLLWCDHMMLKFLSFLECELGPGLITL